jgi:hypothetical protein
LKARALPPPVPVPLVHSLTDCVQGLQVKQVVRQLVPGLTAREVRHLLARVHLWDSGGEAALTLPELQAALTSSTAPPPKQKNAPREPLATPPRGPQPKEALPAVSTLTLPY